MRLLLFNLMTDERDPVLGFASNWLRALAARCAYVDVLTMYQGKLRLPPNVRVYSAGRERGLSKAARLMNFYWRLSRLLLTRRYDACFAHMMPLFAGLAGPLLTARGIPTVLWYTHRQRSAQLRLGLAMSRRVVSADRTSFPYETDKLRVIGHGIDCDFYTPSRAPGSQDEGGGRAGDGGDTLVVQVARLAAIKHQTTAIAAVASTDARLALVGGAQTDAAAAYEAQLRDLIRELRLEERCELTGDLPPTAVRDWYRRATVAVNLSPPGLFDKAALESMACAVPTVVCNPAFAPLLGDCADLLLTAGPEDVGGLSDRLGCLFALSAGERAKIGEKLRENVRREHSLPRLIDSLLAVLEMGELPQ